MQNPFLEYHKEWEKLMEMVQIYTNAEVLRGYNTQMCVIYR